MTTIDTRATLKFLKATAAAQVEQYPQYTNHFTNYKLVRIKRDVRTKMGLAFVKDEYAIAVERTADHPLFSNMGSKFLTVWSRRNQCDTSVRASDVSEVL